MVIKITFTQQQLVRAKRDGLKRTLTRMWAREVAAIKRGLRKWR